METFLSHFSINGILLHAQPISQVKQTLTTPLHYTDNQDDQEDKQNVNGETLIRLELNLTLIDLLTIVISSNYLSTSLR